MSQHVEPRQRRLAVHRVDVLARPVGPVRDQGQVDLTFGQRHATGRDGDIALVDLAASESIAQPPLRGRTASERHQTGRGHVEPVHHQGVRIHGLDPRSKTVLLVLAPAGYRQQSGRLGGHDQCRIAMDKFRRHPPIIAGRRVGIVRRHAAMQADGSFGTPAVGCPDHLDDTKKETEMHSFSPLVGALLLAAVAMTACDKRDQPQPKVEPGNVAEQAERKIDDLRAEARRELVEAKEKVRAAAEQASADLGRVGAEAGDKVTDAVITTTVNAELAKDSNLSAMKIDVDTVSGHVALRGTAPSTAARDHATDLAARVKGVRSVDNQLRVEPPKM